MRAVNTVIYISIADEKRKIRISEMFSVRALFNKIKELFKSKDQR